MGILAEALLFYSDVVLVADYVVLQALLTSVAPEVLIELLESDFLRLAYEADRLAVITQGDANQERHGLVCITAPRHQLQNALPELLTEAIGKSGKARRLAARLSRRIEVIQHPESTTADAREKLLTAAYVGEAVSILLNKLTPEYAGGDDFHVIRDGEMLRVATNIDFAQANVWYRRRVPASHSRLTPAFLLSHLLTVETDLHVAARFGGELAIDDINSALIQLNVNELLRVSRPGQERLERFQEFVFDDSRAVGDAIRAGRYTMADVLAVLPKAKKFQAWIRRDDVTPDIVKAYFREATTLTWVDRLPARSARWVMFTSAGLILDMAGAGGVGTAAGVATGAFDAFLLDKIVRGWKPTQFVDTVRGLVGRDPEVRLADSDPQRPATGR